MAPPKAAGRPQSRIFTNSGCSNRMTLRCCDLVARNLPSTNTNCALFIANCIGRGPAVLGLFGLKGFWWPDSKWVSIRAISTRFGDSSDGTKGLDFLLWLLHELKCS